MRASCALCAPVTYQALSKFNPSDDKESTIGSLVFGICAPIRKMRPSGSGAVQARECESGTYGYEGYEQHHIGMAHVNQKKQIETHTRTHTRTHGNAHTRRYHLDALPPFLARARAHKHSILCYAILRFRTHHYDSSL